MSQRKIFLFWGGSAVLILLAGAFYLIINVNNNNRQTGIETRQYVETMAADTYGGKTPLETLELFVAALKANDADLAAKYFMLDDNLSRERWIKTFNQLKAQDALSKIAEGLNISTAYIKYNKYSQVWKMVNI